MPIITIRYEQEVKPAPRPKPTRRGNHVGLFNPPSYTKYMDNLSLQTQAYLVQNDIYVEGIRTDYLLYEFGVSNLGKDNDNSIKGLQDAIKKSGLIADDNALTIPITNILFFPVSAGKEFIQVTIVHDGEEDDYTRLKTYRDRREVIALGLIKQRR